MLFNNSRHVLFLVRSLLLRQLLPLFRAQNRRFFSSSAQSCLSMPGSSIIDWPSLPIPERNPNPNLKSNAAPNFSRDDFSVIANLFVDPSISQGPALDNALDESGIEPDPALLQAVFDHFGSSPKLLHSLFLWAQKRPGFGPSLTLFNSMINVLAKSREFDSAWILLLERIDRHEEAVFVSGDTFAIMIRRYALAGNALLGRRLELKLELEELSIIQMDVNAGLKAGATWASSEK